MAKVKLPFPLNGTLAGMSIYTRKDLPDPIARTKGGPSKEKILHDPSFDMTRRYGAEFSGCSTASRWLRRRALQPLEPLADFNWAPALLGFLHPILLLDTQRELGKRSIALSQNPALLAEYPLTRRQPFDTVVRTTVLWELDKEALSARVQVGALLPSVNFTPEGPYPLYRLVAVLGAVPDVHHYSGYKYLPDPAYREVAPQHTDSEWFIAKTGSPATTLDVALPEAPGTAPFSLVLSIGLVMGTAGAGGAIEAVNHFGCAKILGAV